MSQNGETHFKNFAAFAASFLVCLSILGHYTLKGKKLIHFQKGTFPKQFWEKRFLEPFGFFSSFFLNILSPGALIGCSKIKQILC